MNQKYKKGFYIKTYGCQMNIYDSQKVTDLLQNAGYEPVSDMSEADIIIFNTCNVREKATEKLYSTLGRIKAKDNDAIVAVAGCVAQAEGEEVLRRAGNVDIVVGPQSLHVLPELIADVERDREKRRVNIEFPDVSKFDFFPKERSGAGVSAFLSIQEGCDKFCTFCCVPYTRGAEYSRPADRVESEARALVAAGAREIVLLGQNVNAYKGWNGKTTVGLPELLRNLASIEGLFRLRYMSAHPSDMSDELYEVHACEKKVMPFVHLPVQSGSDKILTMMNRGYTAGDYMEIVRKIRDIVPNVHFSSDFIVGYPGETDDDFAATLDIVRRVRYAQAFSFKYSPRPGTPAAIRAETDGVPEHIGHARLLILQKLLNEQQYEVNREMSGKMVSVLFEKIADNNKKQLIGRTPYMQLVYTENSTDWIGKEVDVVIKESLGHSLIGDIVSARC